MSRRNRKGRAVHGILLLDKPAGGSSNHALQRAKRAFGARKAGHTGSLDPLATGMLPICFGEATKLSAFLLDADKGYETTLQLGVTTNSADADGEIVETRSVPGDLTLASFTEICHRFKGPLQQVPPMVSAIKIDGQRLYKLAREGKEVERPARAVVIHELEVLLLFRYDCASGGSLLQGTYIRSLVTDIGEAIGCGAHVTALRRTFVSPFDASFQMITMGALEQMVGTPGEEAAVTEARLDRLLLPLDAGLAHLPAVSIDDVGEASFQRGQAATCVIRQTSHPGGNSIVGELPCRVYDAAGRLVGLGELTKSGEQVAPRRVLQWE